MCQFVRDRSSGSLNGVVRSVKWVMVLVCTYSQHLDVLHKPMQVFVRFRCASSFGIEVQVRSMDGSFNGVV